ncbi:MAG: hypothetical protein U1C71_02490, partial [archaeon]|nr:hypothetical protein [archaeon]
MNIPRCVLIDEKAFDRMTPKPPIIGKHRGIDGHLYVIIEERRLIELNLNVEGPVIRLPREVVEKLKDPRPGEPFHIRGPGAPATIFHERRRPKPPQP